MPAQIQHFSYHAPFGALGIQCNQQQLLSIVFLPEVLPLPAAQHALAHEIIAQLDAYFRAPNFVFDLPFQLTGTPHQQAVWRAMRAIPCGQTRRYGELAAEIASCAQAVGQACGHNPLPIVVPCHRVVAKTGLGGFFHRQDDAALNIKRWLLQHESTAGFALRP